MSSEHSRLSPSASERWLSCPASVRLAAALPPSPSSTYAHEGTLAHALAEIEGLREFGKITDREYLKRRAAWVKETKESRLTDEDRETMAAHVADLMELIHERLALYPASSVFFEQRLDTGIPTCWGTSDVVIVSPRHVEIIDLKYGQGIAVEAFGNSQLRLYGLGALDTFGDLLGDTEVVRITVFQPRISSLSTEELSADEIREWRQEILPIAELALGDSAPFGPSEKACRFCPAAGQCIPQMEWATSADFSAPAELMAPSDIADLLETLPGIRKWCDQVSERAFALAHNESTPIPGYKVVMSGSVRTIADEPVARETFSGLGFTDEDYLTKPKIVGLGALETLLKRLPKTKPEGASRERFLRLEDVLPEGVIGATEGRPALVRDDDPRPSASPLDEARRDFQ